MQSEWIPIFVPIVFQEVFDHNNPDPGAIIHIWKSANAEQRSRDLARVTAAGHPALMSACWYLNLISYGADWKSGTSEYYYCDPRAFPGTYQQKQLVLGGVATMWGEFVDGTNVEARLW